MFTLIRLWRMQVAKGQVELIAADSSGELSTDQGLSLGQPWYFGPCDDLPSLVNSAIKSLNGH